MSTSFKKNYPSFNRKIVSHSPHIFTIDETGETAENIIDGWIEKITLDIQTQMDLLKSKNDTFSDEEVSNL